MSTGWRDEAACNDDPTPDLWFVSEKNRHGIRAAKDACARCPVVESCLTEAMADPSLAGVWGGLTETERANMRRRGKRKSQSRASA